MPKLQEITLEDLIIAYRKAKSNAYYENGHLLLESFAIYEESLEKNLKELLRAINENDQSYFTSRSFTGGYTYIPKGLFHEPKQSGVYQSDKLHELSELKDVQVQTRLIGYKHDVDFHVLGSLWIDKIGYELETHLSDSVYGCRLRRPGQLSDSISKIGNQAVELTDLPGHFRKYIFDYKRWQNDALEAAKSAIDKGKEVAIMTLDIRKFYHRLYPNFLTNQDFIDSITDGFFHEAARSGLSQLLEECYKSWSNNVLEDEIHEDHIDYFENSEPHVGIPLAISSSKVIANIFLHQLDRDIKKNITPIFYGRYVDDIILVLENPGSFNSAEEAWARLRKSLDGQITVDTKVNNQGYEVPLVYKYQNSFSDNYNYQLEFPVDKQKLFLLNGKSGEIFIETVKEGMAETSSEWRDLPDPDIDLDNLYKKIAGAGGDNGERVNTLRKANGVSIKRMEFSIELRNMEAITDFLSKSQSEQYLGKFFSFCTENIITPKGIFDFFNFIPRVHALMVKMEDIEAIKTMWERISKCFKEIRKEHANNRSDEIDKLESYLFELIEEATISSLTPKELIHE